MIEGYLIPGGQRSSGRSTGSRHRLSRHMDRDDGRYTELKY